MKLLQVIFSLFRNPQQSSTPSRKQTPTRAVAVTDFENSVGEIEILTEQGTTQTVGYQIPTVWPRITDFAGRDVLDRLPPIRKGTKLLIKRQLHHGFVIIIDPAPETLDEGANTKVIASKVEPSQRYQTVPKTP